MLIFFQRIPSLCFKLHLVAVACYEGTSHFWLGDVAYNLHVFYLRYFFVSCKRNSEQQFVVFASVKGACAEVHVELFCPDFVNAPP